MSTSGSERTVDDSRVHMTELVLPEDTNSKGTIFGGRVLALVDKCASIAAIRHVRGEVLTVALDSVVFLSGANLGDVLLLEGRLNAAFGTSMEIEVTVHSEDPHTGVRRPTTTALVTMVAVDRHGRPRDVPQLVLGTDDDRARAAAAADRRRRRLARR